MKKLFVMALAVMILLCMAPLESQAAGKVRLNKTSTNIYVGKTTTLKVTGTAKKVKWTSSNKNIATVSSNGKVTGKKAGKAVITAKVSGKKYTCKVNVKNPYLSVTKKTLTQGKSFTLEMKGSSVVKWSSSDKSVATVSSKGKVTAKAKGTATITCKCKNGKSYKCKVTVKENANNGNSGSGNSNNGNSDSNIAEDGHFHRYKKVRVIKEASDTGFGEIEYICKVKGCGKTTTMSYGKAMQYTYKDPDTGEVTKTATRYGYWDTISAREILEGINEYRREKGFSDLKYLDKYTPYMKEHLVSCYFNNCNFAITPDDKSVRYIYNGVGMASDCHDKTYFKTQAGLLKPGNDGLNNAKLFERDDIEVGVACFASASFYSPAKNMSQQYYSEEYWQPVTHYDVVICIFKNKPES